MRILFSGILLSSLAIGQDGRHDQNTAPPVVHGAFGIDFTNQYFFRGILQENQGIIAQPWVTLGWNLHSADDGVKSVDLNVGQWNSLHDGPTGSGGGQTMWYESDFFASLSASVGDRWTVGSTYTAYHSPNGRFGTVEEIAFSAAFDDKGLLGETFSGLQPSVLVAFETRGQADAGSKVGVYGQIALAPSFEAGKLGDMDVTLSVPVTIGLSLSDYYEFGTGSDDALGFVQVGVKASMPLNFMPKRCGPWEGSIGLHYIALGDNNELVNNGDNGELMFTLGLSTSF